MLAETCFFKPGTGMNCCGGVLDKDCDEEENRRLVEIEEIQMLDEVFPTYDTGGNRITPTRFLANHCPTSSDEFTAENDCGGNNPCSNSNCATSSKRAKCFAYQTRCKAQNTEGLSFPFLEDMAGNLALLSGGDVQIIDFSPPDLVFGFGYELTFPLYTPPTVTLGVFFEFSVTLKYGIVLDTRGIREAVTEGQPLKALESFAFKDTFDGVDLPLLVFEATIGLDVGVSAVVVKIGVTGGITFSVEVS